MFIKKKNVNFSYKFLVRIPKIVKKLLKFLIKINTNLYRTNIFWHILLIKRT